MDEPWQRENKICCLIFILVLWGRLRCHLQTTSYQSDPGGKCELRQGGGGGGGGRGGHTWQHPGPGALPSIFMSLQCARLGRDYNSPSGSSHHHLSALWAPLCHFTFTYNLPRVHLGVGTPSVDWRNGDRARRGECSNNWERPLFLSAVCLRR